MKNNLAPSLPPDDVIGYYRKVAEVLFNLATVVGAQNGRLQETESYLNRCLQVHKALHGPREFVM